MKVRDLIHLLGRLPADMPVAFPEYRYFRPVAGVEQRECEIGVAMDVWWNAPLALSEHTPDIVRVAVIVGD